MATLREVRSRISGVRKTQKITRAMKMVAAAKLRRRQLAVLAARPYARKMKELLAHLALHAGHATDLMMPREIKSVAVVVVTTDRGFCGAFNANVMKTAAAHVAAQAPGVSVRLFCIGKKGVDFFGKRMYDLAGRYTGMGANLQFGQAQEIARTIVDAYRRGEYDRVDVIYNEFKSIAQSRIVNEQFLPVAPVAGGGADAAPSDYICEPGEAEILRGMVPRHLNFFLWRVLLESAAAEEGARMAAMENATENAQEMISSLQLQYNKARQASITKELLEIVSGAEALANAQ
jgi:F-type H+-transporting ATPase subunit gamma